ncbi:MAG: VacJ family lipoprotein [Pseudomonadota bacterium]
MPNAALIALTSPLLLAQAPEAALQPHIEPVSTLETAFVAETAWMPGSGTVAHIGTASVLNLQWSLASAQPVQDPPADQEPDDGEDTDDNQIVVEGEYGPRKADPIGRLNEESYRITQQLDETFVEPVAYAYRDGLPGPLRNGLGNVVNNLREPNNALNFLLQGKFGKAFETLGRFAINSTIGIGGLVDVAKKPGINLPFRRNGFANTLGFYGVGPGPYLYLPLTGATSARDLPGSFLDQLLLPVAVGKPFNRPEFTVPFYLVSNLEDRIDVDAELGRIEDTVDPYAARRDSYLYRRARDIAELRGEEPPERPLIMDEVEGTGDFAEPPEEGELIDQSAEEPVDEPAMAVIITRPR